MGRVGKRTEGKGGKKRSEVEGKNKWDREREGKGGDRKGKGREGKREGEREREGTGIVGEGKDMG